MIKKRFVLTILSSSLLCSFAYANETSVTELESITVTATRLPETISDHNISQVQTVSSEELERRGFSTIGEVLKHTMGASIVGSGSWATGVDLRGQGEDQFGMNPSVRVMVDGVPVSVNKSHGSVNLDSIIGIDEIERIEVLPGGGAVQYGSGTRGGAVNIVTKGYTKDKLSVATQFQSFGHGQNGGSLTIDGAKKIFDGLALGVNAALKNEDGYREFVKDREARINTKAFIKFNENNRLNLGYGYFKGKYNGYDSLTAEQVAENRRQNTPHATEITRRHRANADFTSDISDNWQLTANVNWRNEETPGSWSNFADEIITVNAGAKFKYGNQSYITGGLVHENHQGDTTYVSGSVAEVNKKANAVWLMNHHRFNPLFSLTTGARYERTKYAYNYKVNTEGDSNNYAFEITPKFHYSDDGNVYARFVRGFTTPNPAQFRGTKSTMVAGSPRPMQTYFTVDLKPATFNTFEIGGEHHFGNNHQINWALFHTDTKDDIVQIGDAHGASYYENIDKTRRYGLELGAKQKIADKVSLYENLYLTQAKRHSGEKNGEKVPYVSKVKATAGVDVAWTERFNTFADLTYYSKAKDNTGGDTKAYALVDLGAKYHWNKLTLTGGIHNVFNKKYFAFQGNATGQGGGNTAYDPADGRSFYVRLKYDF